jgi:predicted HicB family RNase H-like nuclease
MNPYNYSIIVRRVKDDEYGPCFESKVRELPDVAEYADSFQEAYELAIDTIETTAQALAEQGRKMPQPAPARSDYSGRITVRTTRSLHRDLALLAEEENVSLNQLIVSALGFYTGLRAMRFSAHWRQAEEPGTKLTDADKPDLRIVRDQSVDPDGQWSKAV